MCGSGIKLAFVEVSVLVLKPATFGLHIIYMIELVCATSSSTTGWSRAAAFILQTSEHFNVASVGHVLAGMQQPLTKRDQH